MSTTTTTTTPLLAGPGEQRPSENKIVFSDETTKIYFGSTLVHLQITETEVNIISHTDGSVLHHFSHQNLIGANYKLLQKKVPNNLASNAVHQFNLFYYLIRKPWFCGSGAADHKRYRKEVRLYFYNLPQDSCDAYLANLQALVHRLVFQATPVEFLDPSRYQVKPIPQKSILVFVNPVSGKRMAVSVYKKYVEPMLNEANMKIELIITKYAFHAKEWVSDPKNDLLVYSSILTIGGDGILQEVINGIIQRGKNIIDLESGVGGGTGEKSAEAAEAAGLAILKQIPVIPIPGGTGNGVSKSILHAVHEDPAPLNAVFNVIKGKPFPLDLSRVITKDGKVHYAFLMLSWGVVSDIDIHSETLRFLGEVRLTIYGVYYALATRIYRGKLKLKLLSDPRSAGPPVTTIQDQEILSKISINKLLPNDKILEDNWIEMDSEFSLLCILQSSHLATNVHFGPGIRLNDGVFTVYIGHNLSRLSLINILLSADSGGHIYSKSIRILQCTEYILEPISQNGIYSLDGEVVEYGPIHGTVLPSVASVRMIQS
jgi:sphingosine kinase